MAANTWIRSALPFDATYTEGTVKYFPFSEETKYCERAQLISMSNQNGSGAHPTSYPRCIRNFFQRLCDQKAELATHIHPVTRFEIVDF
jgi:hypothetical protein